MGARRIIGIVLLAFGIFALVQGGVFWTERDTVIDAGPLEVQTEDREGFRIPAVLGGLAVVGGILLLVVPDRRRV